MRSNARSYEKEIKRAETINELVWIGADFKQDMALDARDLMTLCREESEKRAALEKAGQKYSRATKPAWR